MAEEVAADRGTWELGLPKGCPCTPALLCQATPHLLSRCHDCSSPEFPVRQDYSLSNSSGEHCDATQDTHCTNGSVKACMLTSPPGLYDGMMQCWACGDIQGCMGFASCAGLMCRAHPECRSPQEHYSAGHDCMRTVSPTAQRRFYLFIFIETVNL